MSPSLLALPRIIDIEPISFWVGSYNVGWCVVAICPRLGVSGSDRLISQSEAVDPLLTSEVRAAMSTVDAKPEVAGGTPRPRKCRHRKSQRPMNEPKLAFAPVRGITF